MHSQLFTPSPLFSDRKSLFVDYEQETLFYLAHDMQVQQRIPMTRTQLRFLASLLTAYPAFCSYAQVLAVVTDQPLEICQEQITHARQKGKMSELLCETRAALDRCNHQLRVLDIQVAALLEIGYVLIPHSHRHDEYILWRDLHPFIHTRFHWRTGAMLTIPPLL